MQPAPSYSPMLPGDASRLAHVPCFQCGYDLFGIEANSSCPECGGAVIRSADPKRLVFMNERLLRRMRAGVRMWIICLLMNLLLVPVGYWSVTTGREVLQFYWLCSAMIAGCVGLWLIGRTIIRYGQGLSRICALLFMCSSLMGLCLNAAISPFAPWQHRYDSIEDLAALAMKARQSGPISGPVTIRNRATLPMEGFGSYVEVVSNMCLVVCVVAFYFEMGRQMRRVPDHVTGHVLFGLSAGAIVLGASDWLGGDDLWWVYFPLLIIECVVSLYGMYRVDRAISRTVMFKDRYQE